MQVIGFSTDLTLVALAKEVLVTETQGGTRWASMDRRILERRIHLQTYKANALRGRVGLQEHDSPKEMETGHRRTDRLENARTRGPHAHTADQVTSSLFPGRVHRCDRCSSFFLKDELDWRYPALIELVVLKQSFSFRLGVPTAVPCTMSKSWS